MKATIALAACAGVIASKPLETKAWDHFGHMEVAYVAYQNLNAQVKDRANTLIKMNPDYTTWTGWIPSGASEDQQKMMIFMIAATWPDEIKGETGYSNDLPRHPDAGTNHGYKDL